MMIECRSCGHYDSVTTTTRHQWTDIKSITSDYLTGHCPHCALDQNESSEPNLPDLPAP